MIVCFLKPKAKKKIEACGFKKETEQAVAPTGTLDWAGEHGVVLGGAAVLVTRRDGATLMLWEAYLQGG